MNERQKLLERIKRTATKIAADCDHPDADPQTLVRRMEQCGRLIKSEYVVIDEHATFDPNAPGVREALEEFRG